MFEVVVHAHVHVHLPYVLMGQLAAFEIKNDKALQQVIVEHQVNIEVFALCADPLLPGDESEAFA